MMKNKKKVGRNDLCPCGSRKKYKKCCLGKTPLQSSIFQSSELEHMRLEFADYDQLELIATLGGLQVYPENHSHTLRLEVATQIACSKKNDGKRKINLNKLQTTLNKYLPSDGNIGLMEDPSENLFTENIVFHGGNYIVNSGITEGGSYILKNLFESIFQNEDDFSKTSEIVKVASLTLLTLSNEVMNRMGYLRNMDSPDTWGEDIKIPDEKHTRKLYDAVIFTKQEIDSLLKPIGLDHTFLKPFITLVGEPKFVDEDIFKNPLLTKPLIEIDDKIIVAIPGSIISALRHFIIFIFQKLDLHKILAEKFKKNVFINVQECFRLMLFKRVDIPFPLLREMLPIEESIFRIDSDKFAYVQFIVDDFINYNVNEPYGAWEMGNLSQKIDERRETVANWLTTGECPICRNILIITVIGSIGRSIFLSLNKKPNNSRTIVISAENLEIITQLRDCDNLTLWKYARARESLIDSTRLSEFSFLDEYALYKDYNHSFYINDEKQPNYILISPGYGRLLRIKASRMWDNHGALGGNPPRYITVCRRYEDESIPIYFPEGGIGRSLDFLIEGYAQPIWVCPEDKPDEIPDKLRREYFEITEMFAYWIWQLTYSLRSHLEPLGSTPIQILFRLENPDTWGDSAEKIIDTSKNIPTFKSEIDKHNIVFTIPNGIQSWLQRVDNLGERLIINGLMQSFYDMLDINSQCHSLYEVERKRILNIHAPIGRKKKLFYINNNVASLNPHNLPKLREVQEHDIEEQLNGLVKELGKKAPSIGEVIDQKERIKLSRELVEIYYNRLKSILSKFAWQPLLELLIGSNEAILFHREYTWLTISTRIECFGNLKSGVQQLSKDLPKIESTALTTRVLIEIVSAEPPKGTYQVSIDDLDKLLAITYHLVNWAMLSDRINYQIFDHKLSILASGRIGTETENIEGIWDPFIRSKSLENVESAILYFQSQFDENNLEKTEFYEYESAFKAEFGLTMTQIVEFHTFLIEVGFEQNCVVPRLNLLELKNRMKNKLRWSDVEINTAINLFSLTPRKKWEIPPHGFSDDDIWPWRYNRRLSYLRRPLIMGLEPNGNNIVFWGPRHAEKSGKNLIGLVESGRYKPHKDSSEEMKSLIGRIKNRVGKEFLNEVTKWFEINTDWFVDSEVPIKPETALNSEKDLGDIDILAIDNINNIIFSIECKNLNYGRNPREISNEIERLIGDKEETNSWIKKHVKRDEWLKNNITIFSSAYKLQSEAYKICSFFLTSEEIPTTFIRNKDLELPFISFTYLKRKGLMTLNDLDK